jgi:Arc/MetJ family transcription regulator
LSSRVQRAGEGNNYKELEMKKTPSIVAQIYGAALTLGGTRNAMSKASRQLLRELEKKNTTPEDLERMRAAQAKRDRRAARRAA